MMTGAERIKEMKTKEERAAFANANNRAWDAFYATKSRCIKDGMRDQEAMETANLKYTEVLREAGF